MTRTVTDRFTVTYVLQAREESDARALARSVQIEQTIEFPYELLTDSWIRTEVVGQLVSLTRRDEEHFVAEISYPSDLAGGEITQCLNLLFGNSSLLPGVWVEDMTLSPALSQIFAGPRFGIEGIRSLLQVPHRPLLQAVVKPVGSTTSTLANLCRAYAEAGVDVIKDDHGITNQQYAPFRERVAACVDAVREGRFRSGARTLFAANVSADAGDTIERAHEAKELGAEALLVAPALVGLGTMHRLATDPALQLPIIAHPALSGGFTMSGVSGISMPFWFGTLLRLCGADMPIFVTYGGRFPFTADTCLATVRRAHEARIGVRASCPCPGGGVTEARLPELMRLYGRDVMYLVGGDMFRRGPSLVENAKAFLALIETGSAYATPHASI